MTIIRLLGKLNINTIVVTCIIRTLVLPTMDVVTITSLELISVSSARSTIESAKPEFLSSHSLPNNEIPQDHYRKVPIPQFGVYIANVLSKPEIKSRGPTAMGPNNLCGSNYETPKYCRTGDGNHSLQLTRSDHSSRTSLS